MYVSNKDVDTMANLRDLLGSLIERGAEGDHWQQLAADSASLFDKMKRQRDKNVLNRHVKRSLSKLESDLKNKRS